MASANTKGQTMQSAKRQTESAEQAKPVARFANRSAAESVAKNVTKPASAKVPKAKRHIHTTLRLTDNENTQMLQNMQQAGIQNKSHYLRKAIQDTRIIQMDISELTEIRRLVAISANNINQVAKRTNETGHLRAADMIVLSSEVAELQRRIGEAVQSVKQLADVIKMVRKSKPNNST